MGGCACDIEITTHLPAACGEPSACAVKNRCAALPLPCEIGVLVSSGWRTSRTATSPNADYHMTFKLPQTLSASSQQEAADQQLHSK